MVDRGIFEMFGDSLGVVGISMKEAAYKVFVGFDGNEVTVVS